MRTPLYFSFEKLLFLQVVTNHFLQTSSFTVSPALQPKISSTRFITQSRYLLSSSDTAEEDVSRWDLMYMEGEMRRNEIVKQVEGSKDNLFLDGLLERDMRSSEVRVVSFDLDNTLWKTGPTISAANDALASFLNENEIKQPIRVENVMKNLFKASKSTYCPLQEDDDENVKAPVLLTLLRKHAIQYILEEHNNFSEQEAIQFSERAFMKWTDARHEAIQHNFASNVIQCLEGISSIRTSDGHPVLVGAITDGNSDPRRIDILKQYFVFCVNAENVGIAKPDKRVFLKAIRQLSSHEALKAVLGDDSSGSKSDDQLAEAIGPWWVHIGDDFAKDIVAAKSMNMRTIWCQELVGDKNKDSSTGASTSPAASEKTVEEFVKEIAEKKVIKMSVGADDYLAAAIQEEFADAITAEFPNLESILLRWHGEGIESNSKAKLTINDEEQTKRSDISPTTMAKESVMENTNTVSVSDEKKKFCIHCGTKLPYMAKFCISCGERQPEMP